jgi:hypothetical protein
MEPTPADDYQRADLKNSKIKPTVANQMRKPIKYII